MAWSRDDRLRFVECMNALAAVFNRQIDEALYTGYQLGLSDLAVSDVERAVRRAIRECKFMPTVVELRELSGEMSPRVRAVKAWQNVLRAIAMHGAYHSVTFDDVVINATIRTLGGWQYLCGMNPDEFDRFMPKRFQDTYAVLCDSGVSCEAAAPLCGIFDQENAMHCPQAVRPPRLVKTDLPPHRAGVIPTIEDRRQPLALASSIGNMPEGES